MSGLDKDRLRNQTICFRASPEERQQIEARIKISGMPKGQYYIQSLLHQNVNIIVGKYQSDRLALEIRRLRERLEDVLSNDSVSESEDVLNVCKALLEQLCVIIKQNGGEEVGEEDFIAKNTKG